MKTSTDEIIEELNFASMALDHKDPDAAQQHINAAIEKLEEQQLKD